MPRKEILLIMQTKMSKNKKQHQQDGLQKTASLLIRTLFKFMFLMFSIALGALIGLFWAIFKKR